MSQYPSHVLSHVIKMLTSHNHVLYCPRNIILSTHIINQQIHFILFRAPRRTNAQLPRPCPTFSSWTHSPRSYPLPLSPFTLIEKHPPSLLCQQGNIFNFCCPRVANFCTTVIFSSCLWENRYISVYIYITQDSFPTTFQTNPPNIWRDKKHTLSFSLFNIRHFTQYTSHENSYQFWVIESISGIWKTLWKCPKFVTWQSTLSCCFGLLPHYNNSRFIQYYSISNSVLTVMQTQVVHLIGYRPPRCSPHSWPIPRHLPPPPPDITISFTVSLTRTPPVLTLFHIEWNPRLISN